MTDRNRIDLIGRYMSGSMRPDELAEFQHRLKSDASLQRMMEAEDLIRTTIRRDLDAIPTSHAATRMRVMDLLADAGRHAPGVAGGAAGGSSAGTSAGSSAGASAGTGLTWVTKAFLGSIVGLGLVTGGYMLVKSDRAPQQPPPAVSAPATPAHPPAGQTVEIEPGTPHEAIPPAGAPDAGGGSQSPALLQETPKNVPLEPQTARTRVGGRRAEGSGATAPASAEPRVTPQNSGKGTVPNNGGAVTPSGAPSSTPQSRAPRKVIPKDEVNVDIQVNDGKPKE